MEDRARGERAKSKHEVALHQFEAIRMTLPALKEANRADAAELLMRAIRSREVILEGRGDDAHPPGHPKSWITDRDSDVGREDLTGVEQERACCGRRLARTRTTRSSHLQTGSSYFR